MFSLNCIERKRESPPIKAEVLFLLRYDLSRKYIPRLMKKTFIRSGKPIVANIISEGNNAAKKAAVKEMFALSVNMIVIL
jgi:hypothetical protein